MKGAAGNKPASTYVVSGDNNVAIKETVDRVLLGEGIGWLKLNRLKKLMEEEMHRCLMLNYLQRKFGQVRRNPCKQSWRLNLQFDEFNRFFASPIQSLPISTALFNLVKLDKLRQKKFVKSPTPSPGLFA